MPVSPESAEAPFWTQVLLGLAGFGSFAGMIAAAFKSKKPEAHVSVTETAQITDDHGLITKLDRIEGYVRRLADNSDALLGLERDRKAEEEKNRIRAEERVRVQYEEMEKRMNRQLSKADEVERKQGMR